MQKLLIGLLVVGTLLGGSARATVPNTFSVQGVLRDSTGKLQSMMVNVTVNLWDAQTAGNQLAGPYQQSVMATNGLFTMAITDNAILTKLASPPPPPGGVWLELIVGNDTFPRQLVTPGMYSLMSGNADHAATADHATSADSATSATSAGSASTASNVSCSGCITGAMVAGATLHGSNIAGGGAHNHGISYNQSAQNITLAPLAETTTCAACPSGTNVIGGNCNGTNYTAMLVKSFVSSNSWCCDYYNTYNGGNSSYTVSANCLNSAAIP